MSTSRAASSSGSSTAKTCSSHWLAITQEMIDQFSKVTLDPDPMHIDPVWAKENGPFGHTIAFGFLTVSLLTHLFRNALERGNANNRLVAGNYLNYGFDRLRLIAPVPAGARVRGHFSYLDESGKTKAGYPIYRISATVEIEGTDTPALAAEWLSVCVPEGEQRPLQDSNKQASQS